MTEQEDLRDRLTKAEELLQELADLIKSSFEHRDLHYRIVSFLNRRKRIWS